MPNNYFAAGTHVYPFNDGDRSAARTAFEAAQHVAASSSHRVRVYRAGTPYVREMCNRVVGESR